MERRLAAILVADVVGYSRLIRADEEGTLTALKAVRSDLIDPRIAEHNGRIVKLMGDGMLAEFRSAVDAVRAAIEVQDSLALRNAGFPRDKRIELRVGVNLGDVVIDGTDIQGDGVNVAARLEGLANPGEVCISEAVHEQVRNRLDLVFEDLGGRKVKNIDEPVRVWRWAANAGARALGPANTDERPPLPEKPSIAVLPFDNMSGDSEQEYFSDGITEDIITALARWRSFPVIARNSTFTYKNKAVKVQDVARGLGVRYVLEGSVRKEGKRVRITAQLIDANTGHHIWAERYDRDLDDVFALQDEITQRIAATLEPTLVRAELTRSKAKQPGNLDAWDYYLRGRSHLHEFTKEGAARGREMFERAIELDPTYSQAFADLAWTHSRDLLLEHTRDREGSMAKLYGAAQRAVALDDASSSAHHLLSTAYIWRNELDLAIAEGRRAVELNPNDADSLHALGNKLDLAGDAEGIGMMEQAQRLNPQDPQRHMHLSLLARAYLNAQQYEISVECARKAVQRRPDYPPAYYILTIGLGHLGRSAAARSALSECERLHSGFVDTRVDWRPYTGEQSNKHLEEGRRKAGLPDK